MLGARRLATWRIGEGQPRDLLWAYVGVVAIVTFAVWNQLPRYMFGAWAPVCLLAAEAIMRVESVRWPLVLTAVVAGGALSLVLGLSDPVGLFGAFIALWLAVATVQDLLRRCGAHCRE